MVHPALGIAQGDQGNAMLAPAQRASRSARRTNRWPDGPESPSSGFRPLGVAQGWVTCCPVGTASMQT
ncbi:MAG: hypothetical protein JXB10_09155 [Pirellulales bacterium]|nr:hypothetical protein [Pirellulales bacterium]